MLIGQNIGSYTIVSKLGEGGMGEVYRARDTRLHRDVAVKVLAAGTASDPDRLTRFEQEARATAALNHPNIVVVYDVGTHEGQPFLVSELLEGQTLRETIGAGPLPARKAIDYAVQIATGLAAAHDKGIVHRDLKPDNVFITGDGRAKILDFGIAKLMAAPDEIATLATAASPRTGAGIVLGTTGYMSPEQIRGTAVDQRADIFALGEMLFEMLSGTRPFAGETSADAMSAVLSRDPAELVMPDGSTPAAIDRLIRRCLEKAPDHRFQSARDLGFALEAITLGTGRRGSTAVTAAVPAPARSTWRERAAWLLAAALAAVAAVLALRPGPEAPPPAAAARFMLELPFKSTNANFFMTVSPDGAWLVVQTPGGEAERESLQIRKLDGAGFTKIPGTAGGRSPVWSPDSRSIAFVANRELRRIDLGATESRLVAKMPSSLSGNSSAVNAAGDFLIGFNSSPLHVLRSSGSNLEPLVPLNASVGELEHLGPVFLPDGRRFLFVSVRSGMTTPFVTRLGSLDSAETHDLPEFEDRIIWAGAGHVIFRRGANLLAQAITYAPLALQGAPVPLAGDVSTTIGMRLSLASASATTLAYRTDREMPQQFTWVARDGRTLGHAGPPGQYATFDLSTDGSRLVVSRGEAGAQNIWTLDVAKGTLNRVTVGAVNDVDPRLSPDGRSVIFGSLRDPVRSPYRVTISGQEPERLFAFKGRLFAFDDWSADGKWLLYHDASVSLIQALRLDQLAAEPVAVAKGLSGMLDQAQMSPDGKWVSYHSPESGQAEVYVVPFPPTGDKWQVSVGGGAQALWRRDSRELYYLALDGTVMAVTIAPGSTFEAGNPVRLFRSSVSTVSLGTEQYAVSPDGQRFLFAPFVGDVPIPSVTLLTNWQSLLTQPK